MTADSPTLSIGELEESKKIAKSIGINHLIIKVDELENYNVRKNLNDRCYHCKKELISDLKKIAYKHEIKTIVDGTNADDLKDFRPGSRALKEERIKSPLALMRVNKKEIRKIAKFLNLPNSKKPSMACLASRFPYGQRITYEKVNRVAKTPIVSLSKNPAVVLCRYPGLKAKKNAANNPVERLSTSLPKKYITSTVIPPIIAGK